MRVAPKLQSAHSPGRLPSPLPKITPAHFGLGLEGCLLQGAVQRGGEENRREQQREEQRPAERIREREEWHVCLPPHTRGVPHHPLRVWYIQARCVHNVPTSRVFEPVLSSTFPSIATSGFGGSSVRGCPPMLTACRMLTFPARCWHAADAESKSWDTREAALVLGFQHLNARCVQGPLEQVRSSSWSDCCSSNWVRSTRRPIRSSCRRRTAAAWLGIVCT
jgi:hypothetical protein